MIYGLLAGITWAIETIVIGIALSMASFIQDQEAILLAPFVSTFLHDLISAIWVTLYNILKKNEHGVLKAMSSKNGWFVSLAAIIGGPIGMTGYVMAVKYMGSSIGAVASAIFPAIGTVLAHYFLKERIQWYRWLFLLATMIGIYGLSYSPNVKISNFGLGIVGTLMCSFGWGIEVVILAKCMKDSDNAVKDEIALQIRQTTSAIIYGVVIIPMIHGWRFTIGLFSTPANKAIFVIAIASFFATVSYLSYYKAISQIGASKAMALDVTYAAWSVIFTIIFLHDFTLLDPITIICTVIVIGCGILAAVDFRDLI